MTVEVNMLRKDNGNYMLDMLFVLPRPTEWGPMMGNEPPSFGRQR